MKFISDDETVGRALFVPDWDPGVKRLTPSAFKRCDTSVTRLLDGEQTLINYLKNDVENGKAVVQAVGVISVSKIKAIGLITDNKIHFGVKESITLKNPHHAEIIPFSDEQKTNIKSSVSKGVSRKLVDALNLWIVDTAGLITERIEPKS
ncbi:hypothetical protein [Pantoea sp. Lij88]|uniref:hypothetical protein n=1 Tax=Pantoea sp. Lij88 TaxID=3028622 RepID=UPI0024B9B184|nr:hypothetical protein [Pantoea sp. Lij88]WHQ73431.1 hypothetical protein PU624_00890 [Pantoea sp. Lij88]